MESKFSEVDECFGTKIQIFSRIFFKSRSSKWGFVIFDETFANILKHYAYISQTANWPIEAKIFGQSDIICFLDTFTVLLPWLLLLREFTLWWCQPVQPLNE